MPDVVEATPGRQADIAAEQAYEASVTAALEPKPDAPAVPEAPKPADGTPKPIAQVEPDKDDEDNDEEGDEPAGEEDDQEAASEDDDEDDIDTAEFPAAKAKASEEDLTEALEAQGVTVKLDDIKDPIARKFVETRLKEMNAGFTRAMQGAQAYKAREVAYRAEQRFQQDHREDHIVSLLLEDPALGERVNAKLEEMESPTARKAHAVVVRDAQAQARTAEEQRSADELKWSERGMAVEQYAMRSAAKAGVPYELGVAESIVALIQSRTTSDASGNVIKQGDVSRAEVDSIIREKAEKYQRSIRAHKREAKKQYIADKTADARNAGLKVKPGAGAAPGVGKKPVPANMDEFEASVLAQL